MDWWSDEDNDNTDNGKEEHDIYQNPKLLKLPKTV